MTTVGAVSAALPPAPVLAVLNPVMRWLLRTSAGRVVPGLALLEFSGRRTGRRFRVPVGLHEVDGVRYVLTPASWRVNFTGGGAAVLRHRGHAFAVTGTLERDPQAVAGLIRQILAGGTPPTRIGLRIEPGHEVVTEDVRALDRQAIRLDDVPPLP